MRRANVLTGIIMLSPVWLATPAKADYSLSLKNGKFPAAVSVENATGCIPDAGGYKRGWTEKGWLADSFGDAGYVALSPTYHTNDERVENILTLPEYTVDEGDFLQWRALSVHPDFLDSYRVEISEEPGVWTALKTVDCESAAWTPYVVSLKSYAGHKVSIRFVCYSSDGYILALDKVTINSPEELSLITTNLTPRYFACGQDYSGEYPVTVEILNNGIEITEGSIIFNARIDEEDSEIKESRGEEQLNYGDVIYEIGTPWPTGETRTFEMAAPGHRLESTSYKVSISAAGFNTPLVADDHFYCTPFIRMPLVDEGTGMWCNNCTKGMLEEESLHGEMRGQLIMVNTHCNDPLQNDSYFSELAFSSIPRMMLDRIKASASDKADIVRRYFYGGTNFGIEIKSMEKSADGTLSVSASVATSDLREDYSSIYRIGYVLTADFSGREHPDFYQENSSSQPSALRFYFLPSRIPAELTVFHDVSLTYGDAFSGIEGSLPETLEPGSSYDYDWHISLPEHLDDFNRATLVAYLLNATTGEIMNATAAAVSDFASIGTPYDDAYISQNGRDNGIYSIQGIRLTIPEKDLPSGIYIKKGKKFIIK